MFTRKNGTGTDPLVKTGSGSDHQETNGSGPDPQKKPYPEPSLKEKPDPESNPKEKKAGSWFGFDLLQYDDNSCLKLTYILSWKELLFYRYIYI